MNDLELAFLFLLKDVNQNTESDHVGIVEKIENGIVYTVEGKSAIAVERTTMPWGTMRDFGVWLPGVLKISRKSG